MLSLATIQRLLVVSALVWAITPRWGGFFFGAAWLLLALGSRQRQKHARALMAEHVDKLGQFDEPTKAHVQKYAMAYLWPSVAEGWGTTWQMGALLCLVLMVVMAVWSLVSWTPWFAGFLLPLAAGIWVGSTMSQRTKIGEAVRDEQKPLKTMHDTVMILVRLKTSAGQWPPLPPPEG